MSLLQAIKPSFLTCFSLKHISSVLHVSPLYYMFQIPYMFHP